MKKKNQPSGAGFIVSQQDAEVVADAPKPRKKREPKVEEPAVEVASEEPTEEVPAEAPVAVEAENTDPSF